MNRSVEIDEIVRRQSRTSRTTKISHDTF